MFACVIIMRDNEALKSSLSKFRFQFPYLLGFIGYDEDFRQSGPLDINLVGVESAIRAKVKREKLGKLVL